MRDPSEPWADGELPLPPRPTAEVIVPPRRAYELRSELRRLEEERQRAQHELGGLVVDMARQGVLEPSLLADGAAAVRSRQDQIDALAGALGSTAPSGPPASGTRRAGVLAALLAVAIAGAVAGAWIERRHDGGAAAPVTALSVVTETVTTSAPAPPVTTAPPPAVTNRAKAPAPAARGGRALARRP